MSGDGFVDPIFVKALKALNGKTFEVSEIDATIFEECVIRSWEDFKEILHEDIPEFLLRNFKEAGLEVIDIYHRKDDIQAPEYVVVTNDGMFEVDVVFDWEGDHIAQVYISYVRKYNYKPKITPFGYHSIYSEIIT